MTYTQRIYVVLRIGHAVAAETEVIMKAFHHNIVAVIQICGERLQEGGTIFLLSSGCHENEACNWSPLRNLRNERRIEDKSAELTRRESVPSRKIHNVIDMWWLSRHNRI
ncbi:hypothetical protein M378DRAFT_166191 [Amanita muscaria Koide BX008]|uniref:Uncharacterized protein n=1 Tax=Amanita muscaria (strain Koide BX008) TaxID=946122 RepID=A0A0C2T671_AMAMK|nr:hypothetical protein M378DRAFT_166191 [Amanita muscaria Koide BX008]